MVMERSSHPAPLVAAHNGPPATNHTSTQSSTGLTSGLITGSAHGQPPLPGQGQQPQAAGGNFNPQSLGREFVRQYYTVLNQGPHILHRFYSDDSSFIHGALSRPGDTSEPVYGQAEINARIMSLNFKDCHAKIRQVDSLETWQKAVVVQVTGELSNNGLPMRRFFQTFVLAPRSPTNYYVRTDIFRYQDDIFADDEDAFSESEGAKTDIESPEKQELLIETSPTVLKQVQNIAPEVIRNLNSVETTPLVPQQGINGNGAHHQGGPSLSDAEKLHNESEAVVDGSCVSKQPAEEWTPAVETGDTLPSAPVHVEPTPPGPLLSPGVTQAPVPSGPRSWATLAAAKPSPYVAPVVPAAPTQVILSKPVPVAQPTAPPPPTETMIAAFPKLATAPAVSPSGPAPTEASQAPVEAVPQLPPKQAHSGPQQFQQPQPQRDLNRQRPQRKERGSSFNQRDVQPGNGGENQEPLAPQVGPTEPAGDQQRKGPPPAQAGHAPNQPRLDNQGLPVYPDEMQVFVGNLPSDISEDQLADFFQKFGKILDVRINRTNQKAGAVKTPNYGFVTFEEPRIVKDILKQKPIYFNEHRFNVEEKRSQPPRAPRPGGGAGGPNRGSSGNLSGGPRDGPRRDQDGPRRDNREYRGEGGRGGHGGNRGGHGGSYEGRPYDGGNRRPQGGPPGGQGPSGGGGQGRGAFTKQQPR